MAPARKTGTPGRGDAQRPTPEPAWLDAEPTGSGFYVGVFVLFTAVALFIYGPALNGEFISDDGHYVANNQWIQDLTPENVREILDPTSIVAIVVENYAPVHLLLHGLEWQAFGPRVFGYHVVNVLLHALASVLLVALFRRSGVKAAGALLGGAIFLAHPANVEAVAWISQLKTSSAMVLCTAALLCHPRRPALGALLFGLALLAKPTAAVALFALVGFGWVRSGRSDAADGETWRWGWVALWGALLAGFAVAEFAAFNQTAGQAPPIYPELDVRIRSIFAVGMRYLVMAATGRGVSVFQEPPPAESWLDPWWLAALVAFAVLGVRTGWALWKRREEGVYWLWAVVSFGPICGIIPLPFPLADRYLYFILPGLLGGVLLATSALAAIALPRVAAAAGRERGEVRQIARLGGLALASLLALYFAAAAHARAPVWKSVHLVMADAERNYPDGTAAKTRQARRAAVAGDVATSVAALRAAHARGYNRLDYIIADPGYARVIDAPDFRAFLFELADEWIARFEGRPELSQFELRVLAQAYLVKDDLERALRAIERAEVIGGPIDEEIRSDREKIERSLRIRAHQGSR